MTLQIKTGGIGFLSEKGTGEDEGYWTFSGYASVFDIVDYGNDVVRKGAFEASINHTKGRVPLLYQHATENVIGRTVWMREDSTGLMFKGLIPPTRLGNDVKELLRSGSVTGLSIGYSVPKGGSEHRRDGVRELRQIDLAEISVVVWPMNSEARAILDQAKSMIMKRFEDRFTIADTEWKLSRPFWDLETLSGRERQEYFEAKQREIEREIDEEGLTARQRRYKTALAIQETKKALEKELELT